VFFTTCVHKREKRFRDDSFGRVCVAHLLRLAEVREVAVLAYCLMPDHAHVLLEGLSSSSSTLACFVEWKQRAGHIARVRLGIRLWQASLFDRILRDDEASLAVAAYVLTNPVRGGLASRLGEYPLAGSEAFTVEALAVALQDGSASAWRHTRIPGGRVK
jgi:REP element-mobilizing transposase RayT